MNKVTVTVDNDALVKSPSGKRSLRRWLISPRRSSPRRAVKKHGELKGASTINIAENSSDLSLAPTVVSNATATAFQHQQPQQDSPQEHLNSILSSRGYSTRTYPALESGYFNKPTKLQLASYSGYMMTIIRKDDAKAQETFRKLLSSGISTNPCDFSGESVLHALCRRGNHTLAHIMLQVHAEQTIASVGDAAVDMVQISDDFGRTPLAAACWSSSPSFETVKLLLDRDLHLLQLVDARGSTPLSYVPPEHWPAWIDFLNEVADHYWPEKDEEQRQQEAEVPPPLTLVAPNSRRFPNPANALMLELASLVAAGKMNRAEAECLKYDTEAIIDTISSHSRSKLDFSDSKSRLDFSASCLDDINNIDDNNNNDSFLSHDGGSCSSFSWDQADMADLLEGLSD
jgi:ankyrin repeat protein